MALHIYLTATLTDLLLVIQITDYGGVLSSLRVPKQVGIGMKNTFFAHNYGSRASSANGNGSSFLSNVEIIEILRGLHIGCKSHSKPTSLAPKVAKLRVLW